MFLNPQSEYRPTEYMQAWVRNWLDEQKRVSLGKKLIVGRIEIARAAWSKNSDLLQRKIELPEEAIGKFRDRIGVAGSAEALLLAEAEWARTLYGLLARGYGLEFTRQEGAGEKGSKEERVNSFLDHGNYIAYGLAAVALNGLGISFAFPLLHGKTRRGALVFDVADLIKDAYVMPLAFSCGADTRVKDNAFRAALIERLQEADALDFMFGFIKELSERPF